jgi:DNA modification methylase
LERTPEEYVARLVAVFGEVRRVLRDDGVLWLNLGDSYASTGRSDQSKSPKGTNGQILGKSGREVIWSNDRNENFSWTLPGGIKPKDLVGIPWRVAFALQAGGWYLRQDIIWAKPNPMPESVTDRCTKAHEYIFMLTKSARYFYDAEAMKEPAKVGDCGSSFTKGKTGNKNLTPVGAQERVDDGFRNRRSVWTITTRPYSEAHFATFPPEIPEICIRASSKPGDTVLDPFAGSCTVGWVAKALNREFIGIELNPEYVAMGKRRMKEPWQHGEKELGDDMPLFAEACP